VGVARIAWAINHVNFDRRQMFSIKIICVGVKNYVIVCVFK